ncbi:hypothetical protein [Novosphingobium sp. M1R2S20]|uniref:DUF1844 domain-containing protein n=1 Tax=Novosphingobium rhizovicinum TaxID=3228928 RepID=A0ABV3RCS6_9SPHN
MTDEAEIQTQVAFAALHVAVHCAMTLGGAGLLQSGQGKAIAERLRELADLMDGAPGYEDRPPHLAIDLQRAAHILEQTPGS